MALQGNRARHLLRLCVVLCLLATACQSNTPVTVTSQSSSTQQVNGREGVPTPDSTNEANPFSDPVSGGGIDLRLTRSDIDCTAAGLETHAGTTFVVAHVVVNGNLGEPCFGVPDERLTRAWRILAEITPPGQLHELGVFGGFVTTTSEQNTLAFVNSPSRHESLFKMSINLGEADRHPDELMLTMAHEFAHVFTSLPTQIDRDMTPRDCTTWHNRVGCYRETSLMAEWVELFWDDGRIDQVNIKLEPSPEAGVEQCQFDPSFLGPYAASHPEEDFAESFSAFVFQLDAPTPEVQTKMEWFARQPQLAEFRNRAIEAGMGPTPYVFERCG